MFALLPCHYLLSQAAGTPQSKPGEIPAWLAGKEYQWRATAVDPKTQIDTVLPSIRMERNAIWQPVLQDYRDMEKGGGILTGTPGPPMISDVSLDPWDIWVIATFDHYLVIPIDSDSKLIYTEINFKINQVIRQPHASSLSPGMSFDVDEDGGCIKKANGEIVSWWVSSSQYSPQPGHTYLMVIRPQNNNGKGALYGIGERWDLSTGKAVPDSDSLSCQDNSGHHVICGETTQEAISYLQSVLPIDSSK